MKTQVFAFAGITEQVDRDAIIKAISNGKSRFEMWDQTTSLRDEQHCKNGFLLRARQGDWIVHIDIGGYGNVLP